MFSLTGIINVLVSLKKDERNNGAKEENSKQYDVIRKAYPRIEATLWKLHTTADTDKVIDVLALGMFHIYRVPDLHRYVTSYQLDSRATSSMIMISPEFFTHHIRLVLSVTAGSLPKVSQRAKFLASHCVSY